MATIASINGNPITVGTSGITDGSITDAKLAQTGGVLEALSNVKKDVNVQNIFTGWKQGYYNSSTGVYNENVTNYVCTSEMVEVSTGDLIYIPNASEIAPSTIFFSYYDSNKNHISSEDVLNFINLTSYRAIGVANARYLNLSFGFGSASVTPATVVDALVYRNTGVSQSDFIKFNVEQNNINMVNFRNKYYTWGQGYLSQGSTIVGFIDPITAKTPILVTPKDGYRFAVFRFSAATPSVSTEVSSTGWLTSPHVIAKDDIFLINISKTDGSRIRPAEGYKAIDFMPIVNKSALPSYSIDSAFNKNPVAISKVGTLTYLQSFCKYSGKYYSSDGHHISVQDASFAEISNTALETGHSNSFQLGTGGKAYISGWDDNKIYIVDLDNMVIDDVINLPTTGYTTACVDDINEVAYIFQRTSYPDTEDYYNFIVYDYSNNSVVSTKKIPVKFGAMQACDFYNGRIFALNGTGTSTTPTGFKIYNTNADCIGEYHLQAPYSTQEPEGVFIDRDTQQILISYSSKNVFELK